MGKEKMPITKSFPFMLSILFISGCMNGYSLNRFGIVAGAHTGDLTKLSFNIVNAKWDDAIRSGIMIICCIIGVVISEFIKHTYQGSGDWRKAALMLLGAGLATLTIIPEKEGSAFFSSLCSVYCGYMLNLFRDSTVGTINSTISTGNMRTLGQYLYEAIDPRIKGSWLKFLKFFLLLICYFAGACTISALSYWYQTESILVPSIGCIVLSIIIREAECKE